MTADIGKRSIFLSEAFTLRFTVDLKLVLRVGFAKTRDDLLLKLVVVYMSIT